MNTVVFFLIVLGSLTPAANASKLVPPSESTNKNHYDAFVRLGTEYREKQRKDGVAYMIGGGVSFGAALVLGIQSEEVIPKIGYSLIQALSGAAVYYGASNYFQGDSFTTELDRLQSLEKFLNENKNLSVSERQRILNKLTLSAIQREKTAYFRMKKVRGYVALSTALSSGLTMVFANSRGTGSNITLGFIFLTSTAGAMSDLFFPSKPETLGELFGFNYSALDGSVKGTLTYRW